jgi:Tol biopolymer transport system component
VDPRGSNLYSEQGGKSELVAEISPGRTRDWALSPDGSRLAFIDILSGGARAYVGRTLVIATGAITTLPAEKNHVGASWVPGSPLPSFGGPGGAWQLTDPAPDAAYLVPEDWSPDGSYLVATVYAETSDRTSRPASALELIKRESDGEESTRLRFSDAQGAAFLGWVRNLN